MQLTIMPYPIKQIIAKDNNGKAEKKANQPTCCFFPKFTCHSFNFKKTKIHFKINKMRTNIRNAVFTMKMTIAPERNNLDDACVLDTYGNGYSQLFM